MVIFMKYSEITSPGVHFITEPIRPSSGDRIIAEPGARLVGGVKLKVDRVENGVCVCDLKEHGITPARFVSRGFARKVSPSHSELFINSKPMNISQYPRDGFIKITGVGEPKKSEWDANVGELAGGFYYQDERPKSWRDGQEIWTHGYWAYDWSPSREKIDVFDKEKGFIKNCEPYGVFHYGPGQRFCFFNIIEEVTEPGDYCLDFDGGKLYFIPFEGIDVEKAEIILSMSDQPAFLIDGVENITIEGFTIEDFTGNGIRINASRGVKISGCELRNIGNRAIVADDSFDVLISHCRIHDTGDGGVTLWCGRRDTLEPGRCSVEDCEIYRVARWDRCYETPVKLTGVGLSARRCLIHDCPHTAVLYGGNDMEITDNEIYNVVLETGDAGAIYAGRDYTMRGNVIARNFLHHVGSKIGLGAMGVYNDDCLSGTIIRDNVFYEVQRAAFLGGGVDFLVEGNVFIDCHPSVEVDGRGQSDHKNWRNMVNKLMRERFYNVDGKGVSAAEPPYITKYPELAKIDEYYKSSDDVSIPPSATIRGNVFCSKDKIRMTWSTEGVKLNEENNIDIERGMLPNYLTAHQYEVVSEGFAQKKE